MLRFRLLASTALTLLTATALIAPAATAQSAQATETAPVVDPNRPAQSLAGDVNALWGDIDAFWGDIDAFEGDVNPFWGDIDAFWGDIDAFWGDIDAFGGGVSPLWGDIDAFWGDIDAFWGDIDAFAPANDPARLGLQESFKLLVERSDAVWGDAVAAQTGKSFWDGFAADVFAKYQMDINDPSTFDGLSGVDRTRFFFDWYDGLMQYSGRNQADWWMKATNWTPGLSRSAKAGAGTTIGLLDFTVASSDLLENRVAAMWGSTDLTYRGYTNPMHGHGEAVASLLLAPHDGRGVMGLAPDAKVATYNPFDATGTASWNDIANGINSVNLQGARVINLSLGVPGYTLHPDWNALYSRWTVAALRKNSIFVHAAGNDGVAQTQNIAWNFASDPNMLVVGSVGPSGEISSFSNTPGTACLLNNGVCSQQNLLMNRFIVAPGEWILVNDLSGGVTRRSGTSFAAPQVSGAIALLQSRWSWLKDKPRETADIILLSARDLGAPGVDAVYGRGMLDVARSQSPLNYANLYQTTTNSKGVVTKTSVKLASPSTAGMLFATSASSLTAFEDIGTTYRDFSVPLSAILKTTTKTTTTSRALRTAQTTTTTTSKKFGFAEGQVANPFGLELNMTLAARPVDDQGLSNQLPFATDFSVTSKTGVTLSFGDGLGAQSLSGRRELATNRFDPQRGGVNPVLGLASGGQFVNVEVPLLGSARIALGATSRVQEGLFVDPVTGEELRTNEDVAAYQASATQVQVTQPVGQRLTLSAGYTFLQETDGMLGMQSTNPEAFADGAETDAATLGMKWALSGRMSLSGSATLGRAREQSANEQMLSVSGGGILTSAFEAALDVDGVFGRNDRARVALVQPMYVEQGGLNLTNFEVIDRETGELGSVTRFNSVDGQARKFALDVTYTTPVFDGAGELAGFIRAETASADGAPVQLENLIGGRISLGF